MGALEVGREDSTKVGPPKGVSVLGGLGDKCTWNFLATGNETCVAGALTFMLSPFRGERESTTRRKH